MGDGEVRRPPGRVSNVHNKQTLLSSVSRHKTYELHSPRFIQHVYTSPASPWLISDFNLLCRPLREGSLLFIYIVRFIYRDGETRREEERRSLSLQTCQRGQGHYEAQLAACPHNCFSQHAHPSPRIAAVTHLGFQIFCTQSTINNEDQDCEIHRKIQLMATLRSGSLQADDGGRGEVIRHQAA